ncbi:hypothetical protein MJO29_001787 [Puccinia striiformis f. sp. tritici]|nr:hypothetical protein MJO29_001787 [Puccinia striiformis f. sp. tritici]
MITSAIKPIKYSHLATDHPPDSTSANKKFKPTDPKTFKSAMKHVDKTRQQYVIETCSATLLGRPEALQPLVSSFGKTQSTLVCFQLSLSEEFLPWLSPITPLTIPRMNPYPGPDSILVCGNAKIHKGSQVQEICDEAGVQILADTTEPEWDIHETVDEVITSELCYNYY